MAQHTQALGVAADSAGALPVVVIGNGPVGMQVVHNLRRQLPDAPLVVFGDEPYEPYERLRLWSWLAGELDWLELIGPIDKSSLAGVVQRIGYRVERVDPVEKTVTDNAGTTWAYSKLVLATGSTAHVPNIPGIQLSGVYCFHNLDDAMALLARRARSQHTIVVGGGLVGLEAAHGMQHLGTRVTVVDHADRLLPRHLDQHGSAYLQYELVSLGIAVLLGSGVVRVLGKERVQGVLLRDGTELPCDTLILAAGIRPNVRLAREARLSYCKGVLVDERMRTSDADIYAVGDCAEYREQVTGLVAPGLEQAAVAAANISGDSRSYDGTTVTGQLKVLGVPVFSMGPMGEAARRYYGRSYHYSNPEKGIYRKILVYRHRVVGAIGIGAWEERERLQRFIAVRGWVKPWQMLRFVRHGRLWSEKRS